MATMMTDHGEILRQLSEILEARKEADPQDSYVASLYHDGIDAIAAKIEEEAAEVIEAARSEGDEALVHEVADLWFHSLVMLAHRDLPAARVLDELARRFGVSGHVEKASRN